MRTLRTLPAHPDTDPPVGSPRPTGRWGRARRAAARVGDALAAPAGRQKRTRPAPRLALSAREAADALGMSLRHFERHVQPHLRIRYSGQLRLIPVAELERWLGEQPATRGIAVGGRRDA